MSLKPAHSEDRLLVLTRVLSAALVPILTTAFLILYLFPRDTGQLFAWPIKPPVTAMVLGAAYLGGAYFFARAATQSRWHTVKLGFLPVTAFAGILGVATILHWDKFTQGHPAFLLWAALYFTVPFFLPVIWNRNRPQDSRESMAATRSLPTGIRYGFGVLGATLLIASALFLAAPARMIPTWPWTLTPLTARVLSALFGLSAAVGLGIAVDGRRSAARITCEAQAVSIAFLLSSLWIGRADVDWSSPSAWLFIAGLAGVLILDAAVLGLPDQGPVPIEGARASA